MSILTRLKSWFGGPFNGAQEGQWRGHFAGQGELGNWFQLGPTDDGWQRHLRVDTRTGVAALHAAINAYVHAFVVMTPGHYRMHDNGGLEKQTGSAIARWIHRPNDWQTFAEFIGGMIHALMSSGNAIAVAFRNDRTEVIATVQASSWSVHIDPETGAIFYAVTLNDNVTRAQYMVPARDVLHLRINAEAGRPLHGRSPTQFCAASLATNATLSAFLVSFLNNRASPSYALSSDEKFTAEQMKQLRAAWNEQSKMMASGGTPILGWGLKPHALGVAPGDELLVDTFAMTVEDIARAFSIPRALLGVSETASNAEQLLRSWISLGLGSMVEMVEQSIERLFEMPRSEHVEFDANALLRLDAQAQVTMAKEAVTGGILSIDEARAKLGFMPVQGGYGAIPSQQQQQVPLDLLSQLHAANIDAKLKPEPQAVAQPEPPPEPQNEFTPEQRRMAKLYMLDTITKAANA